MRSRNGFAATTFVASLFDLCCSYNPLLSTLTAVDFKFGAWSRGIGVTLELPEGTAGPGSGAVGGAPLEGVLLGDVLLGGVKNGSSEGGVAPGASLAGGNSFGLVSGNG
jgi:hypothetical protein